MNIGAEIPFRRSAFARRTGSLVFDRERREHTHKTPPSHGMMIWSQGRFRAA